MSQFVAESVLVVAMLVGTACVVAFALWSYRAALTVVRYRRVRRFMRRAL